MTSEADVLRERYFYMLDGNATKRMVAIMEKLLSEGGHENVP
jgi:hypothetical protein